MHGRGGWAALIEQAGTVREISGSAHGTTHNRMELTAICEALETLTGAIEVRTDSTYVEKCFNQNWHERWLRNGSWKGSNGLVKNRDLWERLFGLVWDGRRDVTFVWIRGHAGDPNNHRVDRLARAAALSATRGKGKRKSNAHLFRFDRQCGVDLVAGVDEAGRAALAGPLVAAAVLFDYRTIGRPERRLLAELNDSKKISAAVRERLLPQLLDLAAATATVIVPANEIDRVGLHRSNLNALVGALAGLQLPGGAALPNDAALLVDGFALDGDRYRQVIRGDSQSAAIAAASIIAKTTRDRLMHEYAAVYPAYGFERHVGYLTSAHSAAVVEHGPSPIHRLSYQARCYQQRLFDDSS
ncbi:MAG: ribonuclease HII [Gaiellaceae bacterium MAG52_C11]|nr:ribonuclease HII [Candidatus Gaiellasilicea maunaloa]